MTRARTREPAAPLSGRRRRFMHVLLAAACLPALLPFFWLVGSSLQQRDNVFASPPSWLPTSERVTLRIGEADVPVQVIDRSEETGAWRFRIEAGAVEFGPPGLHQCQSLAVRGAVRLGQRAQRGLADRRPVRGQAQAADRAQTDPDPGERPGSAGGGVQIHARSRPARRCRPCK